MGRRHGHRLCCWCYPPDADVLHRHFLLRQDYVISRWQEMTHSRKQPSVAFWTTGDGWGEKSVLRQAATCLSANRPRHSLPRLPASEAA